MGTSILYNKRFLTEDKENANYFLKSIAYDVKMKGKECAKKVNVWNNVSYLMNKCLVTISIF